MKIHQSAENYLETIYVLTKRNGSVRSIDIANELGFSKPSVSVAMKSLRENGYIDVSGDGRIILLESGIKIAEKLSVGIPTLRVDLYEICGKVYFGEMTFFPCSGFDTTITKEADIKMGEKLNLNHVQGYK